jgi:high-affinity nickel-transport protein
MYPVGILFGLGFDTASEVGLLAITAAAATTGQGSAGAHIRFLGIIALPILLAAGMSLMDTADGAFMAKAYDWAFSSPLRKVYHNMVATGLSVFVALGVGTIEYVQIVSTKLSLQGGPFAWLDNLNFEVLGYAIVATFVVTWIGSAVLFRVRRVEERYSGNVLA